MYVSSNQKDWDTYIPLVLFGYRVLPNPTTGESPFYLLYGREPRLPLDVNFTPPHDLSTSVAEHRQCVVTKLQHAYRIVHENTQLTQQKMKDYYDLNAKAPNYQVGNKVWVYTPKTKKGLSKKLLHNWHGPFRIIKQPSPVHFRVVTCSNQPISTMVHANRLKLYYDRNACPFDILTDDVNDDYLAEDDLPPDSLGVDDTKLIALDINLTVLDIKSIPTSNLKGHEELGVDNKDLLAVEPPVIDNETIFKAEKILGTRVRQGQCQYLIKWAGYPHSQNTWEPETNIFNLQLIDDFQALQHKYESRRVADF